MSTILHSFFHLILIGLLLVILSALPIFSVYKLTNKLEEKKRNLINILFIAFIIPFINFVVYFSSIFFNNYLIGELALWIGFCWLFLILPISFLFVLFIPSKRFVHKKNMLVGILLTSLFGWILVFLTIPFGSFITIKILEEYCPTINYINLFKKEHGVYPKNLQGTSITAKVYTDYKYKTFNNNKDFILEVRQNGQFMKSYLYCSNKAFDECHTNFITPYDYTQVGDWIERENLD